jgi:hypothetical protein
MNRAKNVTMHYRSWHITLGLQKYTNPFLMVASVYTPYNQEARKLASIKE